MSSLPEPCRARGGFLHPGPSPRRQTSHGQTGSPQQRQSCHCSGARPKPKNQSCKFFLQSMNGIFIDFHQHTSYHVLKIFFQYKLSKDGAYSMNFG
jgi:hypothetical protein